jgi:superfamily II DNA/RNA helicase
MFDEGGHRRKLIIFTEHKDTLTYLVQKIHTLLGQAEALVTIDGSVRREERRERQQRFTQDKRVMILVATDAAA